MGVGRSRSLSYPLPVFNRDENGVLWRRDGECNRCGECCRSGDPFKGELGEPKIPNACPLLDLIDGIHVCTDRRHPYYLGGCNVFPQYPRQIVDYPSCSYVFTRVD